MQVWELHAYTQGGVYKKARAAVGRAAAAAAAAAGHVLLKMVWLAQLGTSIRKVAAVGSCLIRHARVGACVRVLFVDLHSALFAHWRCVCLGRGIAPRICCSRWCFARMLFEMVCAGLHSMWRAQQLVFDLGIFRHSFASGVRVSVSGVMLRRSPWGEGLALAHDRRMFHRFGVRS